MPVFEVSNGVELFYTEHGKGPVVVMLHGWTCDGSDWSWLAADLAVDHRVVVVDLRCHGQSTKATDSFGVHVLAEDVAKVLRHIAVDRAVVVGHSMGTLVASALAVEFASLVSALVLIDPRYGIPDDRAEAITAAMKQDPLAAALDVFARFYHVESPLWQRFWHERRLRSMPLSVMAETFMAMWGPGTIGRRSTAGTYLARRRCPMLAIYAGVSTEGAEWERTLVHGPDDEIVVWDGTGHFLHQERPDEFAALLRGWLGEISCPTDEESAAG